MRHFLLVFLLQVLPALLSFLPERHLARSLVMPLLSLVLLHSAQAERWISPQVTLLPLPATLLFFREHQPAGRRER